MATVNVQKQFFSASLWLKPEYLISLIVNNSKQPKTPISDLIIFAIQFFAILSPTIPEVLPVLMGLFGQGRSNAKAAEPQPCTEAL